jgi:superfamily II DNA or RNA helicase
MEMDKKSSTNHVSSYTDYAKFMAGVTAHYLNVKSKYDPMAIFLSSKIDLVPYQIYDFNRLISEERINGNIRALIAYETGLGKTILVGMIIKELLTRSNANPIQPSGSLKSVLILTPPTVLAQFRDEMKRKFGLTFEQFDTQTPVFSNLMIASIETMKLKEWKERLSERTWDLVVVDEFHKISPFNLRGELITLLTAKTRHFIALTATPHDGRSDRYAFRLKSIAPSPIIIRRTKKEAIDISNRKIFDQILHEETVEFPVSLDELTFYRDAERYAKERYQSSGAGALVAVVIGRAVSSSIRAGIKLLKRRRNRLLLGDLQELSREEFDDLFEKVRDGEELSEEDIEKILGAIPESREEKERELTLLNPIIDEGSLIVSNDPVDSKGKHLLELLRNLTSSGKKALIFTGFIETVTYLKALLEKNGYSPVEIISGAVDMEERNRIVEKFSTKPEFKVIIGTDAMGESLNLQAASVEINYEVPWSPVAYIQRVGRIWRLKQAEKHLYIQNFMPAFEIERRVMEVILQKIKIINEEFGEVGLSVFGRELGSVDMLLQQAYAGVEVKAKVENAFGKSVEIGNEVMGVLNKSMSLPSVVNIEELQRANIVNLDNAFSEDDMRRFLIYLKDAGVASGAYPEKNKTQSTYHVFKNKDYIKVETLSFDDEGIKAAIEVGMHLLETENRIQFNYHKRMEGRLSVFSIQVNSQIVCKEIVLVTPEGTLTYQGLLSLAPDFTESTSSVYFMPIEEYKERLGNYWIEKEKATWEDSKKLKWDLLLKETDDYKKTWLRKELEGWIKQKPNTFTVIEEAVICRVAFKETQTDEDWMAKYEVEMAAMKKATEHYIRENFAVADISRQNKGYDLECTRADGIMRVEVKGLRGAKYPELTQNEHRMAKFYAKSFILYVVEFSDIVEEYAIPDPLSNLKVEEIMKPIYRFTGYQSFKI